MFEKVKEFNREMKSKDVHSKDMPISARLLDIQSELGELVKEYLNGSKYGTVDYKIDEEFILEFGDCLYSLLTLADETNIDPSVALDKVLSKYNSRVQKNKNMGSGR